MTGTFNSRLRRTGAFAGALGVVAVLATFSPSPLDVFDAFRTVQTIEVKAPPPLRLEPMAPLATFGVISEKPLFNVGRRRDPAASPSATAAGGLGDAGQFKLLGIASDSGTHRAIILKTGGSPLIAKPGDVVEGWTVEKIDASGVAISGGARTVMLTIPKATNRATVP
jgi:hypothetical protein